MTIFIDTSPSPSLWCNLYLNTMTKRQRQAKLRKAELKASGHTYEDLANLADVSWRMVKFWIDGQRTSARVEAAYHTLTK